MEKVNPLLADPTPVQRPKNAQPWKQVSLSGVASVVVASTVPIATGILAMVLGLKFELALLLVFLPVQLILGILAGRKISGKRGQADAILQVFVVFFAMTVLVLLVSVVWSVIERGSAAISWQFITQNNVYISGTTSLEYGGLGHAIIGTLLVVGLTTLIAVPLGIATAIYLTETRGRTRSTIRTLIQALSGLPSVVAGLFIYAMLIASGVTQFVGYAGSLALLPLMLPTITRVAEESLLLVPQELRNGALALGSSAWRAFYLVTMPAAKSGLVTAVLLGIARVIGETAPLLVTTFAANSTNLNPFNGSIATLPTYLFTYLSNTFDTAIQRAWGAAFVILILVSILFIAARLLTRPKTAKKAGK